MDNRILYPALSGRQIILASQSPRRKQLLEWAEVPFSVRVIATDESFPAELEVSKVPIHIARQKALAVQAQLPTGSNPIIIAADTIVVAGGEIIGKPISAEHAFSILSQLSGATHQVITGVVILGREEVSFADITTVMFHPLDEAEIRYYIDRYQPYDKAGAYGIQEWIGVTGIRSINGDFYNVMGLPVSRVIQALKSDKV